MTITVHVFVESSRDGFLVGVNDDFGAFLQIRKESNLPTSEHFGYEDFLKSMDVIVMGRKTWDFVRTLYLEKKKWWYGRNLPMYVWSHDPEHIDIPTELATQVHGLQGCRTPNDILCFLQSKNFQNVYLDGGPQTISCFLEAGLVDEITIITAPVDVHEGKGFQSDSKFFPACFDSIAQDMYDSGYVKTKYVRQIQKNQKSHE